MWADPFSVAGGCPRGLLGQCFSCVDCQPQDTGPDPSPPAEADSALPSGLCRVLQPPATRATSPWTVARPDGRALGMWDTLPMAETRRKQVDNACLRCLGFDYVPMTWT